MSEIFLQLRSPENGGKISQCQALARTVTISNDAAAVLDRLMSSYSLSESAMLERLVLSTERNAIEVAKTLPNGHACYCACELRFSSTQQDSILSGLIYAKKQVDAVTARLE